MADILALVNWVLSEPLAGDNTSWRTRYPAIALPYLTEFPEGDYVAYYNRFTEGPEAQSSIQYRDADTGQLLAVHPVSESPPFAVGGVDHSDSELPYAPNMGPGNVIYLAGWNSGSTWSVNVDGSENWRHNGDNGNAGLNTFGPFMLPSPDGTQLIAQQLGSTPPNRSIMVLDATDGSLISDVVMGAPTTNSYISGLVWHPDGNVLVATQGSGVSDRGIYHLDLTTGAVEPWLLLTTLGYPVAPAYSYYLSCGQMAAHPGGEGFAMTIWNYDETPSHQYGYHSHIVEVDWAANVTNTYDQSYSNSDSHNMMYTVAYSTDGTKLYSTTDVNKSWVQRFERGPGNVGGDAPWFHCDALNRADWLASGANPSGVDAPYGLWDSVISGVGVYCAPPPNDNLANVEILTGISGTVTGSVACATVEVGEDDRHGGHSIWYSYTPPSDGRLTIDLSGSNYDTYLSVYIGGFTLGNIMLGLYEPDDGFNVEDDDNGTGQTSRIENLHVVEGTNYLIQVDSFGSLDPGEGDVVLTWNFVANPTNDTVWYEWTPTKSGTLTLSLKSCCPAWVWCDSTGSWVAAVVVPSGFEVPVEGATIPDISTLYAPLSHDGIIEIHLGTVGMDPCDVSGGGPNLAWAYWTNRPPNNIEHWSRGFLVDNVGDDLGEMVYIIVSGPNFDETDPSPTWAPISALTGITVTLENEPNCSDPTFNKCMHLDVFTGTDLANLDLIFSQVNYPGNALTFHADANETYWFRVYSNPVGGS